MFNNCIIYICYYKNSEVFNFLNNIEANIKGFNLKRYRILLIFFFSKDV